MPVWNTPYDQWKWIHFARLNLSSEVVTAETTAQTQTGGYVLSLHQTKLSFCERFIHGEDKESNVKFTEHLFITVIISWQV